MKKSRGDGSGGKAGSAGHGGITVREVAERGKKMWGYAATGAAEGSTSGARKEYTENAHDETIRDIIGAGYTRKEIGGYISPQEFSSGTTNNRNSGVSSRNYGGGYYFLDKRERALAKSIKLQGKDGEWRSALAALR